MGELRVGTGTGTGTEAGGMALRVYLPCSFSSQMLYVFSEPEKADHSRKRLLVPPLPCYTPGKVIHPPEP